MDIKTQLEVALKDSMKKGDEVSKRTIRMVLAAIRQVEIDRQVKLDEAGVSKILQKEMKTRRESKEEAIKATRPDLVNAVEAEISVIEKFMPRPLNNDELNGLIEEAISDTGAASPSDMGKIMKVLIPKIAGRLPGDHVSAAVRERLAK